MPSLPPIFQRLFGGTLSQIIGYGVGGAVSSALEPEAEAVRQDVWRLAPIIPNSPADLAAMAVQGVMSEADAAAEARKSGVNGDRFHRLFRVNGDPIAPQEALELWNRGEISEADVSKALLQSRLKPEWVDTFKLLKRQLLQAADLAQMVVQTVMDEGEATAHAAKLGIHADDFHRLVLLSGNPPGPQDTLSLWNRGIFDESEATLALRQSRLKPQWIDAVKRSRIRPASVADAVRAVIRQRIPHERGAAIAHENGINAETFGLLVEAAGRPISIQQALALYNRGLYTRKQVEHVVAFSDVRVEFTPELIELAVRFPSLLQVRQLIQHSVISDEYATELLLHQGYPQKLAESIVAAGHAQKTQAEKDLTKSEITTLFHGGGISRSDAEAMLSQLGYSEQEAGYILDLTEFRRITRFLEAVINRVHSQFVAHKIGVDTVTTELDTIGIATEQRERLIDLWTEERRANVKVLTPAQIVAAHKKGKIDEQTATAKLIELGYDEADAAILLA